MSLSFLAPGDDGDVGIATAFEVRYALGPINSNADFEVAGPVAAPTPQLAGSTEFVTIGNLAPCTRYYVRARAVDEAGNRSALSNQISVRTLCSPAVAEEAVGEASPRVEMAVTGVVSGQARLALNATGGTIREVLVRVHDVTGRLCNVVRLGSIEAGRSLHSVGLGREGAGRANAGMYFVSLEYPGGRVAKRCVWLP